MRKTIAIVGYGPGISSAVAQKFGQNGFSIALIGRTPDKLQAGVTALQAQGIEAAAFPGDASSAESIRATIARVSAEFGPIHVIEWTAYATGAGDLVSAESAAVRAVLETPIVALLAAVQEALPDLRASKGAVLITGGAFGDLGPEMDARAVEFNSMGLALANAAKHKLAGLLNARLKADGVYAGEVVVAGTIKGSAWDKGNANLDGSKVADAFWQLYQERNVSSVRVGP